MIDYTSFSEAPQEALKNWWTQEHPHQCLFAVVNFFDQNQQYRQINHIKNLQLYGNLNSMPMSPFNMTWFGATPANLGWTNKLPTLGFNVTKSCIDTLTSKISKNKVRPRFLTSGGDSQLQRQAKKLTKFVNGVFYANKLYDQGIEVFRDACLFGTGIIKPYIKDDKIVFERVWEEELLVDELDSYYGQPACIYQRKYVNRETLLEIYKEDEEKLQIIRTAKSAGIKGFHLYLTDTVLVVEGWKLNINGPGRHVICLDSGTLLDEEYNRKKYPFVIYRWSTLPIGFWGQGIPDELWSIQMEINKHLFRVQQIIHLMAVPKIMVENGSKVSPGHLNNDVGSIIYYAQGAKPPVVYSPPSVPPELFGYIENLYKKAYEITGISQLSANSKNPLGANASGKALREFSDIETERFAAQALKWEQFYIDCAEHAVELAQEIAKVHPTFEVKALSKGDGLEILKWSDVKLDEDNYVLQCFPTNYFSSTPAAKLQEVQELTQSGFIDKDQSMDLLDFPDLEGELSTSLAPRKLLRKIFDKIIESQEYLAPEPYYDLATGIKLAQLYYNKAVLENEAEETLELLRRWISEANSITQRSIASQQTQMQSAPTQEQAIEQMPQGQVPQIKV